MCLKTNSISMPSSHDMNILIKQTLDNVTASLLDCTYGIELLNRVKQLSWMVLMVLLV